MSIRLNPSIPLLLLLCAISIIAAASFHTTLTQAQTTDAFEVNDDEYFLELNTTLEVPAPGVLENDSDAVNVQLVSGPSGSSPGTLDLRVDGSFTYTPVQDFTGMDTFVYSAEWIDVPTRTLTATVMLNILPFNQPPIARDDLLLIFEDEPDENVRTINVLANDEDPDGNLVPSTLRIDTPAASGIAEIINEEFRYTPNQNFFGTDYALYEICDDGIIQKCSLGLVTIEVRPVNDRPVAVDDSYTAYEGLPLVIPPPGVLANDFDVENDPLMVASGSVTQPTTGSLAMSANGSFVYTPPENTGSFPAQATFTYRVTDNLLVSEPATVTIHLNASPVANPDIYTTSEDTPLIVTNPGVLTNDTDREDDTLSAELVSGPAHGILSLAAGGGFTYTPNQDYNGNDAFTYRASDGWTYSPPATVNIQVTPVNDPPLAVDDVFAIPLEVLVSNSPFVTMTVAAPGVLANDIDIDGDVLTASLVSDPDTGEIDLHPDGGFVLSQIPRGFEGSLSFTYQASDGEYSSSAQATVYYPKITWEAPVSEGVYTVYFGDIPLQVAVDSPVAVQKVVFIWWDAVFSPLDLTWRVLGEDYAYPYSMSFNSNVLRPEWNEVRARVIDIHGNQTTSLSRILIYREPPALLPIIRR